MYRNDEMSSTMSYKFVFYWQIQSLFLFAENSQILLKISVIPLLLIVMYLVALLTLLVNNQLNPLLQ